MKRIVLLAILAILSFSLPLQAQDLGGLTWRCSKRVVKYTMADYNDNVVQDVRLGTGLVYYNYVYKDVPVDEINFFFHGDNQLTSYIMRSSCKTLEDAEKLEMEWLDNFAVTYIELKKDSEGYTIYQLRDALGKFAGVIHIVHIGKRYSVEYINWDTSDAKANVDFKDYRDSSADNKE
ncbi:MAG: hypothetical protein ACOYJG_09765 [Prevotella sp.]|jgi:hypothetical protein